tara:strand:- start:250 stop:1017 length:768 start_codon:yes stop_codon:yes gene_type:complete
MQAVILAGGFGTRLAEETHLKPKPMVEIGGMPILWHILKIYSFYGINEFIICCGYKGYSIKEFFYNYNLHKSDVTFDFSKNDIKIHKNDSEPWKISLIDTGLNTMTGGRLKKVSHYLDDRFCFTYGDGLSDINIKELIDDHIKSKCKATITSVQPPERFGVISHNGKKVTSFQEKPIGENGFINGGYFVLEKNVLDLIENDNTIWEKEPLSNLATSSNLNAFFHNGFWQPMDTLRDKNKLEELWKLNKAPWKVWN